MVAAFPPKNLTILEAQEFILKELKVQRYAVILPIIKLIITILPFVEKNRY